MDPSSDTKSPNSPSIVSSAKVHRIPPGLGPSASSRAALVGTGHGFRCDDLQNGGEMLGTSRRIMENPHELDESFMKMLEDVGKMLEDVGKCWERTVDGCEILHPLKTGVYPITYRVLTIQGDARFLPSWYLLELLKPQNS